MPRPAKPCRLPRGLVPRGGVLALATLASLAGPDARGQGTAAGQQDPPSAEPGIIVTAPRRVEPDFQEQMRFHEEEYQRLRRIYGPGVGRPPDRSEKLLGIPNPDAGKSAIPSPGSAIVQGRRTDR